MQPDWSKIHKELAKVGTNLKLLHAEYAAMAKASGAAFMGYDRFCKSYQRHVLEHGATSRVEHKAGVSVEVDWSGPTLSLHDPVTGQRSTVYLFVACLPFSRYAFVEPKDKSSVENTVGHVATWVSRHCAMKDSPVSML
ncbi:hypothetical protein GCM10007173_31900 [Glutamicibacter ardleyensis]|uniref:Transposase n=1 Tax=Glutamicibacter ardleyensis TaxID=225894 RepID=A0ABQ2DSE6_9MICC|nr:hypothetical protein GCM10007173_31900 [Glutamicibacter ardleyensis]